MPSSRWFKAERTGFQANLRNTVSSKAKMMMVQIARSNLGSRILVPPPDLAAGSAAPRTKPGDANIQAQAPQVRRFDHCFSIIDLTSREGPAHDGRGPDLPLKT